MIKIGTFTQLTLIPVLLGIFAYFKKNNSTLALDVLLLRSKIKYYV